MTRAMSSAAERFERFELVPSRVDDVVGAELFRELQLLVMDVDGDRAGAEDPGVVQAEVTQTADPDDHRGLVRAAWMSVWRSPQVSIGTSN